MKKKNSGTTIFVSGEFASTSCFETYKTKISYIYNLVQNPLFQNIQTTY